MLNLTYKGTIGGLMDYIYGVANCSSCSGKGWYNVDDGIGCVDAEYCICQDMLSSEKLDWDIFVKFTNQRSLFKKEFSGILGK